MGRLEKLYLVGVCLWPLMGCVGDQDVLHEKCATNIR